MSPVSMSQATIYDRFMLPIPPVMHCENPIPGPQKNLDP